MRIDLGSIIMNADVAFDGATWYATGIEGWSGPGLRQSSQPPSSRDGQVLLENRLDTRALTLTGVGKATNVPDFWKAYNRLLAVTGDLVNPIPLTVYEDTVGKFVNVYRSGPPRISFIGQSTLNFEVSLIAFDPVKFDSVAITVALAAAGTVTLANAGTYISEPVVTLTAAGTVILTQGSRTLTSGATSLPIGTVIDFHKRTVYDGATNRYAALIASSQWWEIPVGGGVVSNTGTAAVSFNYRQAWI